MPARRILLVEDDASIRQGIAEFLGLEGYAVDAVSNGEEALDYLRATAPALLVLDLLMPVMTGPQLLVRLREEGLAAGVPVVLMTASMPSASTLPEAQAYLAKPFDLDELLQVVAAHVGPPARTPA